VVVLVGEVVEIEVMEEAEVEVVEIEVMVEKKIM